MISKTVRKLLAVSLAAIMAIGAAGCGNGGETQTPDPGNENKPNENTPEPTEEPEVAPEYVVIKDANGNTVDLGGMQIIVRDWWSDGSSTDAKLEAAANAYDEDRQKTKNAGMNEHLAKPIEPQLLYETLGSFL